METFRPYSLVHALVVVAFLATTVGLVRLRRQREARAPGRGGAGVDGWVAGAAAVVAVASNAWPLMPWHFRPEWSLPLHVCDLAAVAVPLALLTGRRWLRSVAYFWGIGLSTQSFVTPDLHHGPATVGFWLFWAVHFSVVGVPTYDVVARGYRPRWRDYAVAQGLGTAWILVLFGIDAVTGWNYGYVGPSRAGQPTIVDALGPWPLRAVWVMLLGTAALLALILPWEVARWLGAGRDAPRDVGQKALSAP